MIAYTVTQNKMGPSVRSAKRYFFIEENYWVYYLFLLDGVLFEDL